MKKYRLVPETELLDLLENSNKLQALENGGVDNWDWYGASIRDYFEACITELNLELDEDEDLDFTTIAKIDLNNYPIMEL